MAIITLLTDFGPFSHRLSQLKGRLAMANENISVVDIAHNNALMDLREPAFMLRSSYKSFPKNTIHLCCIAPVGISDWCIIAQKEGQFFICFDNGFLSLSIGKENVDFFRFTLSKELKNDFSAMEILSEAALSLIQSSYNTSAIAAPFEQPVEKSFEKPVESGNVLRITVQYIDFYGNVFTNLSREQFDAFTKGHDYSIRISREYKINSISLNYSDNRPGEMLALFGEENLLQLSINQGSFSHLMASEIGTMFIIEQL